MCWRAGDWDTGRIIYNPYIIVFVPKKANPCPTISHTEATSLRKGFPPALPNPDQPTMASSKVRSSSPRPGPRRPSNLRSSASTRSSSPKSGAGAWKYRACVRICSARCFSSSTSARFSGGRGGPSGGRRDRGCDVHAAELGTEEVQYRGWHSGMTILRVRGGAKRKRPLKNRRLRRPAPRTDHVHGAEHCPVRVAFWVWKYIPFHSLCNGYSVIGNERGARSVRCVL